MSYNPTIKLLTIQLLVLLKNGIYNILCRKIIIYLYAFSDTPSLQRMLRKFSLCTILKVKFICDSHIVKYLYDDRFVELISNN